MKKIIYILISAALLANGIDAPAQTWRGKHNGLPSGFSAKSVYGNGTSIIVTNSSSFSGSQVYLTPDSSTAFAASPSALGLFATMESNVAKAHGVLFAGSSVGLYKSYDNGQTWVAAGATGAVYQVYSRHDTLYASLGFSVKMSADTGTTWTDLGYTGGSLAVSYLKSGGTLFVGSTSNLQYTNDNGHTWTAISSPSSMNGVSIVGIAALNNNIYAACSNGVYKSTDGGVTWNNVLARDMFSLIAVDSSLLGGTATNGMFQSDMTGTTWTAINTGLPYTGVAAYNAINSISYNDQFIICSAGGDSAIYVIGNGELGLHPVPDTSTTTTAVATISGQENNCSLYPNPATSSITVELNNHTTDNIAIAVYDIMGRKVKTCGHENAPTIKMDTKDLQPGTYFLHITQGKECIVKRFTVIQ